MFNNNGIWQPGEGQTLDLQHPLGRGCRIWLDAGWVENKTVYNRVGIDDVRASKVVMCNMNINDNLIAADSGKALYMNGNDYISCSNVAKNTCCNFTSVIWVKINGDSEDDGGGVCGRYSDLHGARAKVAFVDWGLLYTGHTVGNFFRGRVIVSGTSYSVDSTTVPSNSEYQQVVLVRDGTNAYIYINGILEGTNAAVPAGSMDMDFERIWIGSIIAGTTNDIDCDVKQFAFYDRALPTEEIQQLYETPYAPILNLGIKRLSIYQLLIPEIYNISSEADIAIQDTFNIFNEADVALQKETNISNDADVALQKETDISNSGDIALQETFDTTNEANVALQKETNISNDADVAILQEDNDISNNADTVLQETFDIDVSGDVWLVGTEEVTYAGDVVVYKLHPADITWGEDRNSTFGDLIFDGNTILSGCEVISDGTAYGNIKMTQQAS